MKKITFLTFEGHNRPSARIRCYNFAAILQKKGFQTEVISFVDTLGVDENDIYDLTDTKKILLNYKILPKLLKDKDRIFYMQKVYYHSFAPFLAARASGARLVIDYDDFDFHTPLFRNPVLSRVFTPTFVTRQLLNNAATAIAASRYLKNRLEEVSRNNIPVHLIPTGVDTDKFTYNGNESLRNKEKIVFSWIGLVWGEPIFDNIVFLLESFSRMKMKDHARLEIMGNFFHLGKRLENLISREFAHVDIKLIPWTSPEKIPDYLSTIHVGLLPLIQNTEYNRSKSPTKLFEYMAKGVPAIATRRGEAEFVIQDRVNGFLADSADEMSEKMDALAIDPELRTAMGKAARDAVEKEYALNALGENLAQILTDI